MKIYILRHEDRTMDCTFFSPLTEKGLKNSIDLIDLLKENKINTIYSSPFLRTLQTIFPYSEKYKVPINLEYSLIEFQHEDLIPKNSYSVRLPEYIAKYFNSNPEYVTEFEPEDINYPEKIDDVKKRVKKFFSNLVRNNHNKEINIVIVTHQLACNIMTQLAYVNRKNKSDSEYSLDVNYPKGALTKIMENNEWTFEALNWTYG